MIVESVRSGFDEARARVAPWIQDADAPEAASALRRVADLLSDEGEAIADLFDRQALAIDHFNIALFGRTGTGKSTLLETLSHGSGARVSPGDSDWTTDVEPVTWAG